MSALLRSLIMVLALLLPLQTAAAQEGPDSENVLVMELENGRVMIEMLPEVAPAHVERIRTLVRDGFYDGLTFHRVIDGFMAQTGDPTGTGSGGSDLPDLDAEFSEQPFKRGTVGMARSSDPDSANSQWFITFERAPWLDGEYTVWGQVRQGMPLVDEIKKGNQQRGGVVEDPDKIVRMRILSDIE
ncbi:peptidylprolyl isomerase [Fodinicurvata sediminis]|uniref:peptidylprolyl isomerase n=1 Tax=Fodinicurvata sediminis TaxID=1121832 RepID=UPI0003B6300A|nr:peptidylprolyl isomerase [Fodinicurvata sediminis]